MLSLGYCRKENERFCFFAFILIVFTLKLMPVTGGIGFYLKNILLNWFIFAFFILLTLYGCIFTSYLAFITPFVILGYFFWLAELLLLTLDEPLDKDLIEVVDLFISSWEYRLFWELMRWYIFLFSFVIYLSAIIRLLYWVLR